MLLECLLPSFIDNGFRVSRHRRETKIISNVELKIGKADDESKILEQLTNYEIWIRNFWSLFQFWVGWLVVGSSLFARCRLPFASCFVSFRNQNLIKISLFREISSHRGSRRRRRPNSSIVDASWNNKSYNIASVGSEYHAAEANKQRRK